MAKENNSNLLEMEIVNEPLILSASPAVDPREERARRLGEKYVKFVGDLVPEIVVVRQDFMEKASDETIFGCKTFTEYCTMVLRTSTSHIRRLIAGQNPASKFAAKKPHKKFKKTNRQVVEEGLEREAKQEYKRGKEDGIREEREKAALPAPGVTASPTLTAEYFVVRSTTNGQFLSRRQPTTMTFGSIERAKRFDTDGIKRSLGTWGDDLELVKVEATYTVTPVQPDSEPTEPEPPVTKEEKKLQAIYDELRRIDSDLDSAPVDEFGAYVNETDEKLLRRSVKLDLRRKELEKLVQP
jgi:hypothetical protein